MFIEEWVQASQNRLDLLYQFDHEYDDLAAGVVKQQMASESHGGLCTTPTVDTLP